MNIRQKIEKLDLTWQKVLPIVLVFGVLVYLMVERIQYVLGASANVPMMDYWRYIVEFLEPLFEEGSVWEVYGKPQAGASHRNGGLTALFFLINAKYFGLNTQIEIVLGAVGTFIDCCFLFYVFMKKTPFKRKWLNCGFILMAFALFNINQWEILTLEFAFSFSIRTLLILWSCHYFDSMHLQNKKKISIIFFVVAMYFVVTTLGSYGPGLVGAFVFVSMVQLIVNKENRKRTSIQNGLVILVMLIGLLAFFTGLSSGSGGNPANSLFNMIKDGRMVRAFFLMLGSSIMHIEDATATEPIRRLMILGIILFILYMLALFLYFRRKMYEKTYMPLALMAYTACIILVISYGRIPMFGVNYVISSRYVCDTTIGLAGMLWIFLYELDNVSWYKEKIWAVVKGTTCVFAMLYLVLCLRYSYKIEMGIAPYRKMYCESLIRTIQNNEVLTDSQAAPFQSDTALVNKGLELMRKYHLGIFKEQN